MAVYYNEFNTHAAAWLRELMKAGAIPEGDVDERSIVDVRADDVRGYTACHWFAGIGGWAYALALAGWPADRPVWTGSCPCQPWSAAGQGAGADDPRDLWPTWFKLIAECRPDVVFGEQTPDALAWFDRVSADLEGAGYAVGACDLPAASVGAFHRRQRLWFVADATHGDRWSGELGTQAGVRQDGERWGGSASGRDVDGLEYTARNGREQRRAESGGLGIAGGCGVGDVAEGFWSDVEWIACRDGKARPTQPGLFPLAHGLPARVGRLRGYGNAIVPQVAAEFIAAYLEVTA